MQFTFGDLGVSIKPVQGRDMGDEIYCDYSNASSL